MGDGPSMKGHKMIQEQDRLGSQNLRNSLGTHVFLGCGPHMLVRHPKMIHKGSNGTRTSLRDALNLAIHLASGGFVLTWSHEQSSSPPRCWARSLGLRWAGLAFFTGTDGGTVNHLVAVNTCTRPT